MDRPCPEALQWAKKQLAKAGMRSIQTFDLNAARAGLSDCGCPHHGTEECDCQMVVLLVYGNAQDPITLILHGSNGETWLSVADGSLTGGDNDMITSIQQALENKSAN